MLLLLLLLVSGAFYNRINYCCCCYLECCVCPKELNGGGKLSEVLQFAGESRQLPVLEGVELLVWRWLVDGGEHLVDKVVELDVGLLVGLVTNCDLTPLVDREDLSARHSHR